MSKPLVLNKDLCDGVNCNGIYGECNNGVCKCFYGYSGQNCETPPKCDTYNSANFKINNGVSSDNTTSKTKLWIGILLILIGISCISSGFLIKNFIKYKNTFFIIGLLSSLTGFTLITVYLSSNNSQPPTNYYSCDGVSQSCTPNSQCTEDDPINNCYIDQAACNSGCKKSPTTCDPVCQSGTICQRQTSTSGDYKCVSCSRPSTTTYLCDTTKTPQCTLKECTVGGNCYSNQEECTKNCKPPTTYLCDNTKTPQCTLKECTVGGNCYSNQTECGQKCKKQLTNYLCDTTKTPPNQCTLSDCTVGGNCYSNQEECVSKCTTTPPQPGNFDFTIFYKGINFEGFDNGSPLNGNWHQCVPNKFFDNAIDMNMNIVRLPISPQYILKSIPNSSTKYNDNLFLNPWNSPSTLLCTNDPENWFTPDIDQPSYIKAIKYAISKGLYVILDIHQNEFHLCAFNGSTEMTGDNFVSMWSLIVTYIIKNVKNHQQVIFELYNEPVSDETEPDPNNRRCPYPHDPSDWNNNYVIPAIRAIKQIEIANSSKPHIILATTWGNWSGIHLWNGDNTLPNLISDLKKADFKDTKSSNIVIAGHQYCDNNFSGYGYGCDPSTFNDTSYTEWLNDTNKNLGGFMWFLSEGNIRCDNKVNPQPCTNGKLYIDFLRALSKDKNCLGFTVWNYQIGNFDPKEKQEDNYDGSNMYRNYVQYSKIYPVVNGQYDFSSFTR